MEAKDIEHNLAHLEGRLDTTVNEIHSDIKDIKDTLKTLSNISIKMDYQKEAIDRAFARIEQLEAFKLRADALFNQFIGLKFFAYGLWTVLAGGLGTVLLKVFT